MHRYIHGCMVCICAQVCSCVYEYTCVNMDVQIRGPPRVLFFKCWSPLRGGDQAGFLTSLGLIKEAGLAGRKPQGPTYLCLLIAGFINMCDRARFCCCCCCSFLTDELRSSCLGSKCFTAEPTQICLCLPGTESQAHATVFGSFYVSDRDKTPYRASTLPLN